jgi:hypothetical protein
LSSLKHGRLQVTQHSWWALRSAVTAHVAVSMLPSVTEICCHCTCGCQHVAFSYTDCTVTAHVAVSMLPSVTEIALSLHMWLSACCLQLHRLHCHCTCDCQHVAFSYTDCTVTAHVTVSMLPSVTEIALSLHMWLSACCLQLHRLHCHCTCGCQHVASLKAEKGKEKNAECVGKERAYPKGKQHYHFPLSPQQTTQCYCQSVVDAASEVHLIESCGCQGYCSITTGVWPQT